MCTHLQLPSLLNAQSQRDIDLTLDQVHFHGQSLPPLDLHVPTPVDMEVDVAGLLKALADWGLQPPGRECAETLLAAIYEQAPCECVWEE